MNTLRLLVERKLEKEHLSVRAASQAWDVSHTTIHRILKNDALDLETLLKMCKVLNVTPATALNTQAEDETTSVVSIISVLVEQDPRLATLFTELARDLDAGTVSPDDVLDIVSYAGYRLRNAHQRNDAVHAEGG